MKKHKEEPYDLSKDTDEKVVETYQVYWFYSEWKYQMQFTQKQIGEELTRRGIEIPKPRIKKVGKMTDLS